MVYFVQLRGGGPIKIGYCADDRLEPRIASMQSDCPFELVVTRTIPGGTRAQERELHLAFHGERLRGEWFYPSDALAETANALTELALLDLVEQSADNLAAIRARA